MRYTTSRQQRASSRPEKVTCQPAPNKHKIMIKKFHEYILKQKNSMRFLLHKGVYNGAILAMPPRIIADLEEREMRKKGLSSPAKR